MPGNPQIKFFLSTSSKNAFFFFWKKWNFSSWKSVSFSVVEKPLVFCYDFLTKPIKILWFRDRLLIKVDDSKTIEKLLSGYLEKPEYAYVKCSSENNMKCSCWNFKNASRRGFHEMASARFWTVLAFSNWAFFSTHTQNPSFSLYAFSGWTDVKYSFSLLDFKILCSIISLMWM